jgi:hypothetical protein
MKITANKEQIKQAKQPTANTTKQQQKNQSANSKINS